MDEGFSQIIGSETIALENISDFQMVEKGETLVLVNEIPQINNDKTLLFYSKDLEVKVFIDDILVYSFDMDEEFSFLKTPGNKWNNIIIPTQMSGKSLRIELTSNFENRFLNTITKLYFINESEILSVLLLEHGFRILMSIILFLMSFIVYINAAVWKRDGTKRYFLSLGNVYFCTALWVFSMYNAFDYFLHKPLFSYIISMIMAILLPIVFYEFAKVVHIKKNRLITFFGFVVWINFSVQMILQFIFKISLLDLLPITYAVFFIGAASFIGLIINHMIKSRNNLNFALISLLIVMFGALGEIVVLCVAPKRFDLIGLSSVLGLFVYLIVNNFYILFVEAKIDVQKIELEKNYNKLQNTTLMQQIKAHFFFNTLNTISGLCKYDPKEADNAILTFAQYMRSYMHLINQQENIPFSEELNIVEASLKIEKLRFPDTFNYEIDLDFTNFKLPPLSIQPIVENSMIHGLRKLNKAGMITIKTKKLDDSVQIIITDNGVGFDTDILEQSSSIGLKNLKKRINLMSGGDIEISSYPEKGTQTIVSIPFE